MKQLKHDYFNFKKYRWVLLALTVLLGLCLRLYRLETWRLTSDELSIGYNAFSILKTGKDEWGRELPWVFQAFGDFKLPVYIYSSVPFIALGGLTPLMLKLPSILAGTSLIILIYFLTRQLIDDEVTAFIAAGLMALSPWSLHLSHMALESNLALMFFMIGLNFLIYQLKPKKTYWLVGIMTGLSFGLTLYTYVAYRLIIIMLGLLLLLSWFFVRRWRQSLLFVILGLVFIAIPWAIQFLGRGGSVRFSQLFINQRAGIEAVLIDKHNFCFLIDPHVLHQICRRTFTFPFELMRNFSRSYLAAFMPQFLFFQGDGLIYLHTPGYGQLLFLLLPFYLLGLIFWLTKKKDQISRLILIIFLLTPVPAALVGTPQSVRLSALLPFVVLFTVFGLKVGFKLMKNKRQRVALMVVYGLAYLFLTFRFLIDFLFIYPLQQQSQFYPIGREVAHYVAAHKNEYSLIYVSDDFPDAHILFAFWNQIDPRWYQKNIKRPKTDRYGFQHPYRLGKFEFGPRKGEIFLKEKANRKVLYITGATDDISATKLFKGFSGVHTQAKLVDIQKLRVRLRLSKH